MAALTNHFPVSAPPPMPLRAVRSAGVFIHRDFGLYFLMKSRIRSAVLRRTSAPSRSRLTNDVSFSAARPNSDAATPLRCKKASISASSVSRAVMASNITWKYPSRQLEISGATGSYAIWQYPHMRNHWLPRMIELMRARGLQKADINRQMTKSGKGTFMANLEDRVTKDGKERPASSPSIDSFAKLAKILGVSIGGLYYGEASTPATLSIGGVIKGGEMWQALSKKENKEVPLSFFDYDLAVIQVDTTELYPAYRMGDVLAGTKSIGRNLDNLIGKDCIIETVAGERYIKYLARGGLTGTFSLKSFNPAVDDVENVKIAWAAPIQLVVRGVD